MAKSKITSLLGHRIVSMLGGREDRTFRSWIFESGIFESRIFESWTFWSWTFWSWTFWSWTCKRIYSNVSCFCACVLLIFCFCAQTGAYAQAYEKVSFATPTGTTIFGYLFRSTKPNQPFVGIVALHGCGGLTDRNNQPDLRTRQWGEHLANLGYTVLFPDSFASRQLGSQCRVHTRAIRAHHERIEDAFAAFTYLAKLEGGNDKNIALMGWSNGGSTVLATLSAAPNPQHGTFSKAVAFYPGCRSYIAAGGWHAKTPLLILIGAADDWTPAKPCRELTEQGKKDDLPIEIMVYPHAFHDFDHPSMTLHRRWGLAYTANNSGYAHAGTNPAAREDALRRVPEFLASGKN